MTFIALTIAGSDSGAGAGIQADLKTFSALNVYGTTVITALTAQNTQGVQGIAPVEPDFVRDQMDAIFADMHVDAVKIGMLGTAEIITAVASSLKIHKPAHVVVDPVMVSTSGSRLLTPEATSELIAQILPLATLLTPNLEEASILLNEPVVTDESKMERSARNLAQLGAAAVLLKGGHLTGKNSPDLLYNERQFTHLNVERIDTKNTHGTGCTLSAAITAFLAKGQSLPQAVAHAKSYVTGAIKAADGLDIGKGAGPVNHFWQQPNS